MTLRQRKDNPVSIEEILHTCSNEKVAQAAVASLGFDFATRVRSAAESRGETSGALVARIVLEFGKGAGADERHAIARVMDRADQPILAGLRVMLDCYLQSARADHPWAMAASLRQPQERRPRQIGC
jgi:hypothetical protein